MTTGVLQATKKVAEPSTQRHGIKGGWHFITGILFQKGKHSALCTANEQYVMIMVFLAPKVTLTSSAMVYNMSS
jgi:hypothetical protein